MSQIATSIEQSKKLLALGLSPETADMIFDRDSRLWVKERYVGVAYGSVPAWSLSALMEQLPKNNFTGVDYDSSGGWFCQTFDCASPIFSTPIEAVFDTVCELIENGYRQLPLS